ncbi:hypothetical protein CAEBREN_30144 [Caenorhabditis brenneri]|uniref:RRM domain-containing protein n=1 Tax=Caenorhabditis brenneri TaxID=135651 RepID=G0ML91_CAEBE|nr:hypothetical protein CAEBREN_30144 [Caenorhabditis brenneri]
MAPIDVDAPLSAAIKRSKTDGLSVQINISNLAPTVNIDDLRELFNEYNVENVSVYSDQNGQPTGDIAVSKRSGDRLIRDFKGVSVDEKELKLTIIGNKSILSRISLPNGKQLTSRNRHQKSFKAKKSNKTKKIKKEASMKMTVEQLDAELDAYMNNAPKVGQFLTYDENEANEENGILKVRKIGIEDAKRDDCINMEEDGSIKISSWIAFSSDPRHRTFDRKLAFADWYGLVDCSDVVGLSQKCDAYKTFIVVKDMDYVRNQTQLFKVAVIKGKLQKTSSVELMQRMKDFEENLLNTQSFGTGPPINVAQFLGAMNIKETPILPTQPILEDRTPVGLVRLGSYYEFEYAPIQNNSRYSYEITKKHKKQESLPFNVNIDQEVQAGIHVDLSSPNTKCQVWSFYTGVPFFNSPQVGFVTMADYVDSQGSNKSWQEVLRIYLGNPCARNMYCICRVVKQRVPEKMFNSFMMDEFKSVERYTWQVIKIQAAKEFVNDSEERLKRENLRENIDQLEEEDEVARQKRQNRANVRFEQDLFSSGSSSSNFSYSQSPFQPI